MARRPNILFIMTDQQSAHMMGCAGNPYVRTPAMDRLAATGVRFDRAYCTDPVCIPSRFSLMTGRMPSEIDMRSNATQHINSIPEEIKKTGLGWLIRSAGYEVVYGGKEHLPKMRATDLGFEYICDDERDRLADVCAEYLRRKHERPFFLVASFINPHDICYMAIRAFAESEHERRLLATGAVELAELDRALPLPEGMTREEFLRRRCPPLPANFESQRDEPGAIGDLLDKRAFKRGAYTHWTKEDWRMHRWAYVRLTERVDGQIGRVLAALRESGLERETLVVFTSDHGDMDATHRLEHKENPYEEVARVPLIVSQPGVTPVGSVNATHLVSNGLDLLPTLCDYAGVDVPEGLAGLSFRALAEGRAPDRWREYLPVESEWGNAIVTERYKYVLFDPGVNREQLYDLSEEPREMRNCAADPAHATALEHHRAVYKQYYG